MNFNPNRFILITVLSIQSLVGWGQVQFAELGNYTLENGQTIRDCQLGYRTFGQLNGDRSNAILFPTWYGGTSESLLSYIGPDQMLDSTQYFIIIVDAFGDGVSSSPSNSEPQPGQSFPEFSIRDMVNAQHRLLTEFLELDHLYAVTGISMGGMQTYQWMASYPEFFDRAIPIIGSPQLTAYDRLLFKLFQQIMEPCLETDCPDITVTTLMLEFIVGFTPQYRVGETTPEEFPDLLATIEEVAQQCQLSDLHSQMKAIAHHDVTLEAGSLAKVAQNFQGETLTIVAQQDHMLLPTYAIELARERDDEILLLDSDCGHYAFACEQEKISQAVRKFLKENHI
ncbi:MAG: alpha/beta hydrolase [Tunicatimonas sp.]|uniref:alpha/beta hydrolase n=1 Tax=Tunicatimonas sp. TaxID=1940096 RepID=UPI003C70E75E